MKFISNLKFILKFTLYPKYYARVIFNDIRSFLNFKPGKTKTIFIAGYPKSGTTWMENFTSLIPGYNPRILNGSKEVLMRHDLPQNAFSRIRTYQYSSFKSHISPSKENIEILIENNINKIVVMYRDPRDIVLSNYNYVLKNNPWNPSDDHYVDYNLIDRNEGLMHSINMVGDFPKWVDGWYKISKINNNINCMYVKYEDFLQNPSIIFQNVLSFYGVKISTKQFQKIVFTSSNKTKISFLPQKLPGMRSTMHKGIIGGWREYLEAEHIVQIKKMFGKTLIDLGYETDLDW